MRRTAHIIGFPWEEKSTLRRGSQLGPWAIRKHLFAAGLLGAAGRGGLVDEGVVRLPKDDNAFLQMERWIAAILRKGGVPIVLGGDHTVTLPSVRAVAAHHGPVNLVWVDRHADLHPDFLGDRWSHACVAARLLEGGTVAELRQFGVRELNEAERRTAERWRVAIQERPGSVSFEDSRPLYLSIDLDVLDPASAPGASAGSEEGWRPEELLEFVRGIPGPIVGLDVVELNPLLDRNGATARVAAELVGQIVTEISAAWELVD